MDQDPNQPESGVESEKIEGDTPNPEGTEDGTTTPEEGVDDQSAGGTQNPQDKTIEIDGKKYTVDEAKELISKGEDYTQKTQTLSEQRKAFEKEKQESEKAKMTEEERIQFEADQKHLDKLGVITKEKLEQQRKQDREDAALEKEIDKTETKYDGKDGRPKFNRKEVLKFAQENGIFNVDIAYKAKHFGALQDWAIKQAGKTKKGISPSKGASSGATPKPGQTPKSFEEAEAATDSVLDNQEE